MHPHTSYLIFATPRSGSYLLCEALIKTRLAGNPTEYFGPVQTKAIMKHLGTSSYTRCLAWILEQGTTPNGVFGGKVIWKFHAEFVSRLRESIGHEELLPHEIPHKAFPNLNYIWMTRRDKVRQAISYWKAMKTDSWMDIRDWQYSEPTISNQQESPFSPQGPTVMQDATFNYEAVEGLRHYLEQSEREIQQYFDTCGIQPFKVVYEDFVDAYEETALQILDYLHIPTPEKLTLRGEHTLKKQANAQSEEWLQRYYQLKQQEEPNRQDINTMQENAAQRYIQANVAPPDPREVNWQAKPLPFKLYRNCEQIPLSSDVGTGSAQGKVPVSGTIPTAPVRETLASHSISDRGRRDSARLLSAPHGLEREQIGQILLDIYGLTRQVHSVPIFHPMLKYLPKEETHVTPFYTSLLRPVPSGGALFPCELYLLVADSGQPSPYDGSGQHVPAGIYHYDAVHHALDILKQGDYTSLLQTTLAHPGDTPPAYTLLLSSFFWKDGFKYGAFSYRLQGLDIGTVISQSEIVTHHTGLSTTIHYQFQDKALNDLLSLAPLYDLYQILRMPNFNLFYMSVSLFPIGDYKSGFQVYGDRWYRMQNMEAGIIAQRIYLATAALKLGCRASLGFSVPETNTFLGLSDAKDASNPYQYMSLMQLMVAPELSAYQHYEQSLLI